MSFIMWATLIAPRTLNEVDDGATGAAQAWDAAGPAEACSAWPVVAALKAGSTKPAPAGADITEAEPELAVDEEVIDINQQIA
ncbi:hypothetical protein [Bordetella genomosp. 4]|uniref:hypothetical protein n=1 Tax=Bordetella genomosp. 4 TaxID=463044 RepID=UPI00211B47A5|nr:hypothetical protein [Bordetella genomosp. 4]